MQLCDFINDYAQCFFHSVFFSTDFMIYLRRCVISLINSILHLSKKKTSQKREIHFWNRWSNRISKGYLKNAHPLWCHLNPYWIRALSALMITWLQLISMMIQLTISFRLIIIIIWNRKKRITFPQLVRFRFDSHSIIIKLRTKKSTNLCFFVNNKDTTETIFFGKSWWWRLVTDEPLNWWISFLAWLFVLCVLGAFFTVWHLMCYILRCLHIDVSISMHSSSLFDSCLLANKKLAFWQEIWLFVKIIHHP